MNHTLLTDEGDELANDKPFDANAAREQYINTGQHESPKLDVILAAIQRVCAKQRYLPLTGTLDGTVISDLEALGFEYELVSYNRKEVATAVKAKITW